MSEQYKPDQQDLENYQKELEEHGELSLEQVQRRYGLAVPGKAKLTLAKIEPYSVVRTFIDNQYDYPETWEALRPLTDAATEKAYPLGYHVRGMLRWLRLARLQLKLDAQLKVVDATAQEERDAAREMVRELVEAAKEAIQHINEGEPYYARKPLDEAVAKANQSPRNPD